MRQRHERTPIFDVGVVEPSCVGHRTSPVRAAFVLRDDLRLVPAVNEAWVGAAPDRTATGPAPEWPKDSGTDSLVALVGRLLLITDRSHSCPTRQPGSPGVSHKTGREGSGPKVAEN